MKIIVGQRRFRDTKKYYKFTCNHCGCIFVCDDAEKYREVLYLDELKYSVICPQCSNDIEFSCLILHKIYPSKKQIERWINANITN